MNITRILIAAIIALSVGCQKRDEAVPKNGFILSDAEYELPADGRALWRQCNQSGGLLSGEISVANGPPVRIDVTVNQKSIWRENGVRRATLTSQKIPAGEFYVSISRPGDEPVSVNIKLTLIAEKLAEYASGYTDKQGFMHIDK